MYGPSDADVKFIVRLVIVGACIAGVAMFALGWGVAVLIPT